MDAKRLEELGSVANSFWMLYDHTHGARATCTNY